ncbi:MAG TPA: adenylate/guanylate cyclase domain-containing protein [Methylomirabilota bacterium]|nr:adenylate/guanylate cyclase domain-containing protein [Methylomirabilota bacterium]
MPRLQAKPFDTPDEVRTPPLADLKLTHLDEVAVGIGVWHPGWRWSTHLKPIAATDWCEHHHRGYAFSGQLHVITETGEQLLIRGDSAYEIPPLHDAWVVGNEPFVALEWSAARMVGVGPEDPGKRIVATVLFTDIADSTVTLERVGDVAWRERLLGHNAALREMLDVFRGQEIATTGDGILAIFDGATRAVRCGAAMAATAARLELPIRVGLHTGEIELIAGNARGLAVHAAARVMAAAQPGEVLVSETTRSLTEGSGLVFEDAGPHQLKGLTGERQLFRLAASPVGPTPRSAGVG